MPRFNQQQFDNTTFNKLDPNLNFDLFDTKSTYSYERDSKGEELRISDNAHMTLPSIDSRISISDFFNVSNTGISDVSDDDNDVKIIEYNESEPKIRDMKIMELTDSDDDKIEDSYSISTITTSHPEELLDDMLFRNFAIQPSRYSGITLDETGKMFLQYFQIEVSKLVTVGIQKSNYFLLTYLKMSDEPAISHSLAAWGGYYLSGSKVNEQVQFHLMQGQSYIKKFIRSKKNLTKRDYMILMCFYLIQLGMNVCSGETFEWKVMFDHVKDIIIKFGGINKMCREFGNSNDIKFFLKTFGYHDIMSSHGSIDGTTFQADDYRLMNRAFEYEVDPLYGCNQEIYLILGELMNLKIEIKKYQSIMDLHLKQGNIDKYEYFKIAKLRLVENEAQKLYRKLEDAKPDNDLLKLTGEDFNLHLKIYELYALSAKMYCMAYIQQIPPNSAQVQLTLVKGLKLIKELSHTKMNIILCFPLLLCGMSSVGYIDRVNVEQVFLSLLSTPIDNLGKALTITKEAWKRNPHGNLIIDWADICDEFGWAFCPC